MKKILSYILIAVIISANLLAPISFGFSKNNSAKVKANVAEAANVYLYLGGVTTDKTVKAKVEARWATSDIDVGKSYITIHIYKGDKTTLQAPARKLSAENLSYGYLGSSIFSTNITADTQYYIDATVVEIDKDGTQSSYTTGKVSVKTNPEGVTKATFSGSSSHSTNTYLPACYLGALSGFSIPGCFAQFLYYAVFTPASALFAIGGVFFDYTFHYALQSSTYQTPFVNQGWKIIRDFANMFFIFILLYIAFGTILDLNGFKTKEMIVNVIIIGLLINFSLFAARLVVDTSNILARVFYNSNTIEITDVSGLDVTKTITGSGKSGILPLSSAVVNKINPQRLLMNTDKAGDLAPDKGGQGEKNPEKNSSNGVGTGTFIIITLLAAAVSIVGFIVFLSVGLVFVGRVIGLWIAMILAPLAFFSYTIPAMRNIEMLGWKKWWPNLLKLSFLAPVFMFFMYLIIKFLQIDLGFGEATGKGGLNYVLTVTLPFVFIMILLWQAKKIATKMSGQFGEALSKAGSAIGGMALGAATGGAAMAMRGTAGRLGSHISNSEAVKNMSSSKNKFVKFFGNKTMDTTSSIGKKSFDLRNTKLGSAAGKGLGVNLGKAKTGGFEKYQTDKVKSQQQRAEKLNVGESSKANKGLRKQEMGLQDVLNSVVVDFEKIDEELKKARRNKKDGVPGATRRISVLKGAEKRIKKLDGTQNTAADLTRARVSLAAMSTGDPKYAQTKDLVDTLEYVDTANTHGKFDHRSIEDRKEDIKLSKEGIKKESTRRKVSFAKGLRTWGSKSNKEAQHKIIMNSKIETKDE